LQSIPGDQKWIVSSLKNDFVGANKNGFKTIFCSDLEGLSEVIPSPDLEVKNLRNAAEVLTHSY
jgi:hypothetical protein